MKHPILYRVVFYGCFSILCATVIALLALMNGAPFKSSDMRLAYYYGCNFGSRPLTNESVDECSRTADMFKETLDDLDKQMEKLNESRHNE